MPSPSIAVSLHLTFDKSFDTLKYITKSFSENDSIYSNEYLQRFIPLYKRFKTRIPALLYPLS